MKMKDIVPQTKRYTFGHSYTAAERLRIIADFFNPLAAEIIADYTSEKIGSAADMGCGPGYTTDMIAQATQSGNTTGIDISPYFLELARKNYPCYTFIQEDVAILKNDVKFDFIYCRFLLSHLLNVQLIIKHWIDLLIPGGILFIDELEGIETALPVFQKYLKTNAELVGSQGSELYIGERLNAVVKKLNCIDNRSDLIPVADSMAASWFYPNTVSIWKDEPFVKRIVTEQERIKIAEE